MERLKGKRTSALSLEADSIPYSPIKDLQLPLRKKPLSSTRKLWDPSSNKCFAVGSGGILTVPRKGPKQRNGETIQTQR